MGTFYRCDRCQVEQSAHLRGSDIALLLTYSRTETSNVELCDSCVRALREWLKPVMRKGGAQ